MRDERRPRQRIHHGDTELNSVGDARRLSKCVDQQTGRVAGQRPARASRGATGPPCVSQWIQLRVFVVNPFATSPSVLAISPASAPHQRSITTPSDADSLLQSSHRSCHVFFRIDKLFQTPAV